MIVGPRYNDVDPAIEAAYEREAEAETATSKLDAIAARLEAATKGPWEPTASLYPDGTYHDHVTAEWDIEVDICEVPRTPQGSADADLIAHAPADLAELLAVVRQVAAANDRYMRGEIPATALSIDIHAAVAPLTEGETDGR